MGAVAPDELALERGADQGRILERAHGSRLTAALIRGLLPK